MTTLQAVFELRGVVCVQTVRPCAAGGRMDRDPVFSFSTVEELDAFAVQLTAARVKLVEYKRAVKLSDLERLRKSADQHASAEAEERRRIAQLETELGIGHDLATA